MPLDVSGNVEVMSEWLPILPNRTQNDRIDSARKDGRLAD